MGQSWGQSHFPHSKLLPDVTVPTLCSRLSFFFSYTISSSHSSLSLLPHTPFLSLSSSWPLFSLSIIASMHLYVHTYTYNLFSPYVSYSYVCFQGWPFCRLGNIFCSWSFSFSCFSLCSRPDVPAVSWCWLPSFILLANWNLIPTLTWRSLIHPINAKSEACLCQYRFWHGNRHEWQGFPSLIKQYTLKDPSQLGSIRTWVLTLV